MKAFKLIATLSAALVLLTGCDFFRSLVGKPTSEDLERMRQEAMEQERLQREQDSIARVRAAELEQEALRQQNLLDESKGRYHVILGSFKVEGNAEKMISLLRKNGYTPEKIQFNNGFEVVSVAAYDNYRDAVRAMEDVMEYQFCPEDVWVYDIRQNMHARQ
ncbi:MAG TPA: SPOR domain-containing protein [Candidatus Coprenecus pullistercoris]|nr:SPOR domain-containing protein [Candidatus Coprenecus pullistercoris]